MGTLVSDRKLFLTERREARICANGVTMRSSPWLQDQTGKDQFSCSFLMCVKRDTTRRGGGSMGEHSGLRWTQRVSQKLLSKFMQGVWRSLSVANCTPVSLWSRYDLVPIPISSEQKQRNWNGPPSSNHSFYKSILRRKRERVRAGVERERSMKEGGVIEICSPYSFHNPYPRGEKRKYSFDFDEIMVGNHSNFHNRNLFISENNAIVKFITSAGVRGETRARFMPISVSNQLQGKHIFVGITFDRNDYSIKTKLSSDKIARIRMIQE